MEIRKRRRNTVVIFFISTSHSIYIKRKTACQYNWSSNFNPCFCSFSSLTGWTWQFLLKKKGGN